MGARPQCLALAEMEYSSNGRIVSSPDDQFFMPF